MKKIKAVWKMLLLCLMLCAVLPLGIGRAEAASLSKPTLKKVTNTTDGVKVTWKKVSGADGYVIYRKTGSGSYAQIDTGEGVSTLSYTDATAVSGKTYQYTVAAYKDETTGSYKTGLKIKYLATPTISEASVASSSVTLTWAKVSGVKGYKIYRKTSGSYKLIKTVSKSKTSYTDSSASASTSYTYKVVAYKGSYKSAGATTTCETEEAQNVSVSDLSSSYIYAIEADVKLTGSGTGYHAKLVAATASSAVSFGIQFDNYAVSPYTGKAAFLCENVVSNASGGQTYTRCSYGSSKYASTGKTYHLMIAITKKGVVDLYVNEEKVGSVKNSGLANTTVYLRVEGSARKNGDKVKATFSNIGQKKNGSIVETPTVSAIWLTGEGLKTNTSVGATPSKITVSGTLKGLTSAQDWDNAYGIVSGTVQFY